MLGGVLDMVIPKLCEKHIILFVKELHSNLQAHLQMWLKKFGGGGGGQDKPAGIGCRPPKNGEISRELVNVTTSRQYLDYEKKSIYTGLRN